VAARLQSIPADMRTLRRIVVAVALLLPLATIGCDGTDPAPISDDGGDGNGNLALFAPCTDNSECMSGLCTQTSYDKSPTPICTYQCDAQDMNPLCPMGCNPKGYCKKPN